MPPFPGAPSRGDAPPPAAPPAQPQQEGILDRLGQGWFLIRDCTIDGGDPAPARVDIVLLHPRIGVALLQLAPRWTADAAGQLSRRLHLARFGAIFPGYLPVAHLRLRRQELAELPRMLAEAFASQPPLSLQGGDAWIPAVRRALQGGPVPRAARDGKPGPAASPRRATARGRQMAVAASGMALIAVLAAVALLRPDAAPTGTIADAAALPDAADDAATAGTRWPVAAMADALIRDDGGAAKDQPAGPAPGTGRNLPDGAAPAGRLAPAPAFRQAEVDDKARAASPPKPALSAATLPVPAEAEAPAPAAPASPVVVPAIRPPVPLPGFRPPAVAELPAAAAGPAPSSGSPPPPAPAVAAPPAPAPAASDPVPPAVPGLGIVPEARSASTVPEARSTSIVPGTRAPASLSEAPALPGLPEAPAANSLPEARAADSVPEAGAASSPPVVRAPDSLPETRAVESPPEPRAVAGVPGAPVLVGPPDPRALDTLPRAPDAGLPPGGRAVEPKPALAAGSVAAPLPPPPVAPALLVPAPAPAAVPAPRPPRADPAAIAALVRRGDALLALGDVSAARRFYERAAEAGSADAADAAGRTHEAAVLQALGARGIRADPDAAAAWRRRAAALRMQDQGAGR